MDRIYFTKKQARQFLLLKHGLLGDYKFVGKEGILSFIRQAGCIQFDPVDVCGRNADLVLQSRIKDYQKTMLYELLYIDRKLVDYFDKNLAILPIENWKYFDRERQAHRSWERSHTEIVEVQERVREEIARRGPLCSADLDIVEKVSWYWSDTRLSRAALEHMYFVGELGIHHKSGTLKYYDLIENCIPEEFLNQPEPFPSDFDYRKWLVSERIGSVGLLWNRASDAWLGIQGLKAAQRNAIFEMLLKEEKIIEVKVEEIGEPLYCRREDAGLAEFILKNPPMKKRCEFIAPLDNLIWDRKLIGAVFDFSYKWEIYTPKQQRKYGYYVLPILYGDRFAGRIEMAYDKKQGKLELKNIWYEPDLRLTKALQRDVDRRIRRFERFCRKRGWNDWRDCKSHR